MAVKNKSIMELPEITDLDDYWVLGSKQGETEEEIFSGRYLLPKYIQEATQKIMLERRVHFKIYKDVEEIFLDEPTTIYKISTRNISSLSINGQDVALLPVDGYDGVSEAETALDFDIHQVITVSSVKQLTDPSAFIYIYAKVRLI